ncbi:response regulator transcription factor [soil metagenome]
MRIAILDDDPVQIDQLLRILKAPLNSDYEETTCVPFAEGEHLRRALRRETFDLLVLDWNLPDLDGVELLHWLREEKRDLTPVLMLSARTSEKDVARALTRGADDYVIKPFRPLELRARLARLYKRPATVNTEPHNLKFGSWHFDRFHGTVSFAPESGSDGGTRIEPRTTQLTESEFKLALALFRNMGNAVSRSYLIEKAGYDGDDATSRTLDSHIYRLRGKLTLTGERGYVLRTVYGKGYRLEATEK